VPRDPKSTVPIRTTPDRNVMRSEPSDSRSRVPETPALGSNQDGRIATQRFRFSMVTNCYSDTIPTANHGSNGQGVTQHQALQPRRSTPNPAAPCNLAAGPRRRQRLGALMAHSPTFWSMNRDAYSFYPKWGRK
jgi:hypothetical protein